MQCLTILSDLNVDEFVVIRHICIPQTENHISSCETEWDGDKTGPEATPPSGSECVKLLGSYLFYLSLVNMFLYIVRFE